MLKDPTKEPSNSKVLLSLHSQIENNKAIRRSFLKKLPNELLCCAVCSLRRPDLERKVQETLYEIHYDVPTSGVLGGPKSIINDVVLLCVSCHHGLHDLMMEKQAIVPISEAKQDLLDLNVLACPASAPPADFAAEKTFSVSKQANSLKFRFRSLPRSTRH